MRSRIHLTCLLWCCFFFQVGAGGLGATLEVQSLFSVVPTGAAGPALVVFCLLRLSRCFCSSAVCLLCRRLSYCFLFVLCLVVVVFSASSPFFFTAEPLDSSLFFVRTVLVTCQAVFVFFLG